MKHPHEVWLGLGANLGDPLDQLVRTVDLLDRDRSFSEVRSSRIWRGAYVGPGGTQPAYFNLCLFARTGLTPAEVRSITQGMEREAGRPDDTHGDPRVLDIDLLLFDTLVLDTPELILPHPRMRERRFVLAPLAELDPELSLPPDGVRVLDLLASQRVASQELEVVGTVPSPAQESES